MNLLFYAQFTKDKLGENVSATIDISSVNRSTGAIATVVSGGTTTHVVAGIRCYLLTGADLSTYDYTGAMLTADTTVDLRQVPTLWSLFDASVFERIGAPAGASIAADLAVINGFVNDVEGLLATLQATANSLNTGQTALANALTIIQGYTDGVETSQVLLAGAIETVRLFVDTVESSNTAFNTALTNLQTAINEARDNTSELPDMIVDGAFTEAALANVPASEAVVGDETIQGIVTGVREQINAAGVTVSSPTAENGDAEVVQGADYKRALGTSLNFILTGDIIETNKADIATVEYIAGSRSILAVEADWDDLGDGDGIEVFVDLTKAQTRALPVLPNNYTQFIEITLTSGDVLPTSMQGTLTVKHGGE